MALCWKVGCSCYASPSECAANFLRQTLSRKVREFEPEFGELGFGSHLIQTGGRCDNLHPYDSRDSMGSACCSLKPVPGDNKAQLFRHEFLHQATSITVQLKLRRAGPTSSAVRDANIAALFFRFTLVDPLGRSPRFVHQFGEVPPATLQPLKLLHLGCMRSVHEALDLARPGRLKRVEAEQIVRIACLERRGPVQDFAFCDPDFHKSEVAFGISWIFHYQKVNVAVLSTVHIQTGLRLQTEDSPRARDP